MLKHTEDKLYPLEVYKALYKRDTYYDRDTRGQSYFYLAGYFSNKFLLRTSDGRYVHDCNGRGILTRGET